MSLKRIYRYILLAGMLILSASVYAEAEKPGDKAETGTFANQVSNLKEQVLELNKDLFILEEELLFPVNTQVNVFVSIDAGYLFELDSVRLKIDDKVVSNYLYTERELAALHRGGVQRLYVGNMTTGEHELTAIFIGTGPSNRDYKRASTVKLNKSNEAQFVELRIKANTSKEQPEFDIKIWE